MDAPQPVIDIIPSLKHAQHNDMSYTVVTPSSLAHCGTCWSSGLAFFLSLCESPSPQSLEKRASQALISHVDLPPERGSDRPSTVNICQPVNSDADGRHLPVTLPVLNWVAHPARSWAPLRRFLCSNVSCMPYR